MDGTGRPYCKGLAAIARLKSRRFPMRWIPYAAVCAVFLASADFFVKLASSRISSSLGAMVYGLTTLTAGLAWVLYERATGQPQFATPQGWGYAFLVGLAFSGVTFLLYITFTRVE